MVDNRVRQRRATLAVDISRNSSLLSTKSVGNYVRKSGQAAKRLGLWRLPSFGAEDSMIGRVGARLLMTLSFLVTVPATVYAHGGGLNAEGCHNNRRTGEYHCHRSGYSPPRYVPAPTAP